MNWTDSENTLGPRTWTFGFNGYGQIWIKWKLNPGPETGLKARKFGFKARTKYSVYNNAVVSACRPRVVQMRMP